MTSSPHRADAAGHDPERASLPRNWLRHLFLDHPASVGESYEEHFRVAGGIGATLLLAGLACIVHALVPAWFKKTGSGTINRLHARLHKDAQRDGKRPEWEI